MTKEIKVCMGSACFAKGNLENLEYIKEYIKNNDIDSKVSIIGGLCENKCQDGPRIIVDDKEFVNVTKDILDDILSNI